LLLVLMKEFVRCWDVCKRFVTQNILQQMFVNSVQPPKLQDHSLSAMCKCLFTTFAASVSEWCLLYQEYKLILSCGRETPWAWTLKKG
jgi:hypothetical protein